MKGTVVIISSVHWHSTWQRHHDIAAGLADRDYEVLFVEPLPKRWPSLAELGRVWGRLTGSSRSAGTGTQVEIAGITIVSPRLLPDVGPLAQWINRRFFLPGVIGDLKRRISASPLIVLNYLPIRASVYLQQGLRPDLAVYDCVWDWQHDPFSRPADIVEGQLLDRMDLVFADSPFLVNKMRRQHRRVLQILPAVHYEMFEPARREGARHYRPVCAYFGSIGVNIDVDLLRVVGRRYPLRVIGPANAELKGFPPSTEFTGAVPHRRVPELLCDADVLLLPYASVEHTPAVIPAKTFECLATGKPTVVIGLSSLEEYRDVFYITRSHEEFMDAVDRAAHENDAALRQRRLERARENDWSHRVQQVEDAMLAALREKEAAAAPTTPRRPA